ncbi:hypothetical protein ACERK3_08465 [Phycisphaerales bacterium AB-hyl4]|uniref:Type II secretion system protein GspE N-terminal domain-containing protein n=1 Tax=Natronomicrosphaera hydrolytica TaxID=3242702 RepID=A0ABV4U4R8_9BACT
MESQQVGRFLVERGVLTQTQLQQANRRSGLDRRPIWQHAAELNNLTESEVWNQCAAELVRQCPHGNLFRERREDNCMAVLSARDAWENLVLPLRVEDGQMVCATTEETLAQALPLMMRASDLPCRFILVAVHSIEQFIAELYHYEGIEVED